MGSLNHYTPTGVVTQSLPFAVEVASVEDLEQVAQLRAKSYGKHLPELGERLREPEAADFDPGCELIVARSKLDGELLGTMRMHTNAYAALPVQMSKALPERFTGTKMVEATRLCVPGSLGASLVRTALFKALHQYCLILDVDWIIAAGRRPIDRLYEGLLFTDVSTPGEFYPMAHAGNIPHRVMCMPSRSARVIWEARKHPLFGFAFVTQHPDINLSDIKHPDQWACPTPLVGGAAALPQCSEENKGMESSLPL